MNTINTETALLYFWIITIINAAAISALWLQNRQHVKGSGAWVISFAVTALSSGMLLLGEAIPHYISLTIPFILLPGAMVIFYIGLGHFIRKTIYMAHNYIFLSISAFASIFFSIFRFSKAALFTTLLFFLLIISLQCAFVLLWKIEDDLKNIYRGGAIVFILISLLSGVAIVALYADWPDISSLSIMILSGAVLTIILTVSLFLIINGQLLLNIENFSIERKNTAKELRTLAVTDRLTRIYDRMKLEELLTAEVLRSQRYQRPLSIILIDVDHFKKINDKHGYFVGDILLQEIAEFLKSNIRKADNIGRWGGEEFLIINPETTLSGTRKLAEKLRKKIAELSFNEAVKITISIGIAALQESEWQEEMVHRADEALSKAKKAGRNRVEG